MAPGFTELDEIGDLTAARGRAWRDYLDRERALGAPSLVRRSSTRVSRPRDLDCGLRPVVCNFPEVDFPPGDGAEARPRRRRGARSMRSGRS